MKPVAILAFSLCLLCPVVSEPLGSEVGQAVRLRVGAASGSDYADLVEAVAAQGARESGRPVEILLEPGVYRVSGLVLRGEVSIRGADTARCVLEAAEEPGLARDRVLSVAKGARVRLEGLTVRH